MQKKEQWEKDWPVSDVEKFDHSKYVDSLEIPFGNNYNSFHLLWQMFIIRCTKYNQRQKSARKCRENISEINWIF